MEESVPLTGGGMARSKLSIIVTIVVVIFLFLTFLFAVLSYATSNQTNQNINNQFLQASAMRHNYNVHTGNSIKKGSVVSFCEEHKICGGLGPVWNHRAFIAPSPGVESPAAIASLTQITPSLAVYGWIPLTDHNTIHVATVSTQTEPHVAGFSSLKIDYPVTSLRVRGLHDNVFLPQNQAGHPIPNSKAILYSWVMLYTDHNTTYLRVGSAMDAVNVTFGEPVTLYSVPPTANYTIISDIVVCETWIIVTYGTSGDTRSTYVIYEIDHNANTRLKRVDFNVGSFNIPPRTVISTTYLGNWTIMQASSNHVQIGRMNPQRLTIDLLKATDFSTRFYTLKLTPVFGNRVVFSGTQTEWVDAPITLTMVVEWTQVAPYLALHYPTNLLANQNHQLVGFQLHSCYHEPTATEPYGGLYFSYVDGFSLIPKIIRAKMVLTRNYEWMLLPSPALDLATVKYGAFGSWHGPMLTCPSSNADILMVYQNHVSVFDTFTWAGGFRYAGIAENDAKDNQEVVVTRRGISTGHQYLQTGFHYYLYNDGNIWPHTSYLELFTPNGHRNAIGVALSPTELLLYDEAFETWGA